MARNLLNSTKFVKQQSEIKLLQNTKGTVKDANILVNNWLIRRIKTIQQSLSEPLQRTRCAVNDVNILVNKCSLGYKSS